jgi:hypothetical protein
VGLDTGLYDDWRLALEKVSVSRFVNADPYVTARQRGEPEGGAARNAGLHGLLSFLVPFRSCRPLYPKLPPTIRRGRSGLRRFGSKRRIQQIADSPNP